MKLVKFRDIKHKMPKDSWMYDRNEKNNGEFDEYWVLFLEGDYEVENLDLDDPLVSLNFSVESGESSPEEVICSAILVDGNLRANNIYNYETDGSTGLYVLGNIHAENMLIGGQELYVSGNLNIKDCFWGHYNHGDLIVKGYTSARVFAATEEYHYDYNKVRIKADFFLCDHDCEDDVFDPAIPYAIFEKAMLYTENDVEIEDLFTWKDWMSRSTAIRLLKKKQPILLRDIDILSEEEKQNLILSGIPNEFGESHFNDEESFGLQLQNFEKLLEISRMHSKDNYQYYEWKNYEVQIHYEKFEEHGHVMFTHDSGLTFFICIEEEEGTALSLKTLFRKNEKKKSLSAVYRKDSNDSFSNVFEQTTESFYLEELQLLWTELLERAKCGAYFYTKFRETVKVENLLQYLNLPVVQLKYNDYWDLDKSYFWYNYYCFTLRLHDARGLVGSIDVAQEIKGDVFDLRTFYFRPDAVMNPQYCELYYASSQEGRTSDRYSVVDKRIKVFLYDWQLYQEALHWYAKIDTALLYENQSYLEDQEL
ncbi:hypothetical protein ACR79M_09515 [Sphingobacterium spiritivorum]|uniref:hypothetical protein n=1 Tax=Sphingobacterium spiritivorum TaxID=258 RepID=UPI003DA285CE